MGGMDGSGPFRNAAEDGNDLSDIWLIDGVLAAFPGGKSMLPESLCTDKENCLYKSIQSSTLLVPAKTIR